MINLADYCTPDSIRAALGVSVEELPDTVVTQPIYTVTLAEALLDIEPDLIAAYNALLPPHDPAANEARFMGIVQTYATYNIAQQMLSAVPMFAPQTIADSKAQMVRNDDASKNLAADILGSLNYLRERILKTYAILFPDQPVAATTARIFGGSVGIAFDPVLNR